MDLPETTRKPPFNITRASHTALTVKDLAASRDFYTQVIGLVVTREERDAVYLRGVEEIAHHSLVLHKASGKPQCELLGLRVGDEEDLELAHHHFTTAGMSPAWVERPFQGRTLSVRDPLGIPLEFCARMEKQKRLHMAYHLHKGAAALRFDHVQVLAPDVMKAASFYTGLGFRISDYFTTDPPDRQLLGAFLYRKNNPHDIVFLTRPGPRFHHFGYIVSDPSMLFRALDTAGSLGLSSQFERGPGRHGQGHQLYVYFRDPDGHRVEVLPPPIQLMDADEAPVLWEADQRFTWDLPPPSGWLLEASDFQGTTISDPMVEQKLFSLEDFLARKRLA